LSFIDQLLPYHGVLMMMMMMLMNDNNYILSSFSQKEKLKRREIA